MIGNGYSNMFFCGMVSYGAAIVVPTGWACIVGSLDVIYDGLALGLDS